MSLRITGADRADIRCRITGDGFVLAVEAQASTQAWVEYSTEQVHFAQAFGPGSVHRAADLPRNVSGVGPQAFWVPADGELATTNGTQSTAGSYLTVIVSHHPRGTPSRLAVASAVGRAALAVAPRGPNPGPPPS